ncbi:uncharacterized protein BXZ73DRAFT_72926 [Epithele typhae]|uniref:uncharacterized protein n=1 Tax=Epithele typhae TaxID=378194 RepID=UPI0020081904|nr:uncharacterized protein BXZ73DRAFT_72926 [Epithele typhae]KAH9946074.1 hypothetical protein BXZ73DRAFT_72926 [Epithele typhae]
MAIDLAPQALAPPLPIHPSTRRAPRRPVAVVDDVFYTQRPVTRSMTHGKPLSYHLPEDLSPRNLSKPPCSTTKRRRNVSRNLSRTPRHRHCTRADCCISIRGSPSPFDDLPWISALSLDPDPYNLADIADLSLIDTVMDEETVPSVGPGPVRRRKTSLRSDPLARKDDEPSTPVRAFPFARRALFQFDQVPQTPPLRAPYEPSEVTFRDLRPVFPYDDEVRTSPTGVDTSR